MENSKTHLGRTVNRYWMDFWFTQYFIMHTFQKIIPAKLVENSQGK